MRTIYILSHRRRRWFRWGVRIKGVFATLDAALRQYQKSEWLMDDHCNWYQMIDKRFKVTVQMYFVFGD